jgi:hypothetical protein
MVGNTSMRTSSSTCTTTSDGQPPSYPRSQEKSTTDGSSRIGSDFTHRGGYKTPDGIIICRTLRNKVKTLQEEFTDEARIQRARAGLARAAGMPPFIQPLIEDGYMEPESRPRFYRPPTPSPSADDSFNQDTPYQRAQRARIQARDAGN